jgi:hypothetical protein
MKKIKLMISGLLLVLAGITHAQVEVQVSAGVVPPWAPAEAVGVRYYYLPDIEAYYDVNTANYIYFSNGVWVHAGHLPPGYEHYDIYHGYKVVLNDYHGERPYDNFKVHRRDYPKGYNNHGHEQKLYRDRDKHEEHGDHR